MKDDIAFRQSKSLGHTRAFFDIFKYLAEKAVGGEGDKIFGTKPKVAGYSETDLGTEADKAAKSNLGNMDDIMALLEKINPGYTESLKQGGKNTLSLLRGEIPKDVQDQVQRSSAYRSLMGGFGGSGMSKALTTRDFGRTSLDMMQAGTNSAQAWAGISQGSVAPYMVTAPAQADATFRNNLYSQATKQFQFNVDAAPDPTAAGVFNLQTSLGAMAASFGMGSAMGGMRGGGASGGMGGGSGGGMSAGAAGAGNAYGQPNLYSSYGPYESGYRWGG